MKSQSRPAALSGLVVATLLGLGLSGPSSAVASTPTAVAADPPSVAYKKITKQCSSLTVDGQKQQQCQVDFTVAVTNVRKGYRVIVLSTDRRHSSTSVVGRFPVNGKQASRRFTDVVSSYGEAQRPERLAFRVKVKNAAGKNVLVTKPRVFR